MNYVYDTNFAVGPGMSVIIVLILITGFIAQWRFFEKWGFAGIFSLIPIWNFAIWMRILGRSPIQMLYFLIPGFNIYFYIKIHIELCKLIGKTEVSHYLLSLIFSVFYVAFSGLSRDKKFVSAVLEPKNLL